jgi:hypothetical protein
MRAGMYVTHHMGQDAHVAHIVGALLQLYQLLWRYYRHVGSGVVGGDLGRRDGGAVAWYGDATR